MYSLLQTELNQSNELLHLLPQLFLDVSCIALEPPDCETVSCEATDGVHIKMTLLDIRATPPSAVAHLIPVLFPFVCLLSV